MVDFSMLLPSFVLFVREQYPSKRYDYMSNHNCAFAQFLHSQGYRDCIVGGNTFCLYDDGMDIQFPREFAYDVLEPSHPTNATFGALSQRLDMYLEQHPIKLVAGEL